MSAICWFRQEKRAARGCKRPKSREETPKEGGGNASNRATALQQYVSAPHKKQGALTYFHSPLPAAEIRVAIPWFRNPGPAVACPKRSPRLSARIVRTEISNERIDIGLFGKNIDHRNKRVRRRRWGYFSARVPSIL
jgi:hypothetical protein